MVGDEAEPLPSSLEGGCTSLKTSIMQPAANNIINPTFLLPKPKESQPTAAGYVTLRRYEGGHVPAGLVYHFPPTNAQNLHTNPPSFQEPPSCKLSSAHVQSSSQAPAQPPHTTPNPVQTPGPTLNQTTIQLQTHTKQPTHSIDPRRTSPLQSNVHTTKTPHHLSAQATPHVPHSQSDKTLYSGLPSNPPLNHRSKPSINQLKLIPTWPPSPSKTRRDDHLTSKPYAHAKAQLCPRCHGPRILQLDRR
ncbi:hypothetical protein LIER_26492 [Lithospermum erythrorhizon]|uniref:Uncharacterized protein n=1 Tax=Lithospermum erythrorhizon TaxID=34254 RepID=A0AAV3REE7_LITER